MNVEQVRDWVDRHAMIVSAGACGRAIGYLAGPDGVVVQLAPVGPRIVLRGDTNVPHTVGHSRWVPTWLCREAVGSR